MKRTLMLFITILVASSMMILAQDKTTKKAEGKKKEGKEAMIKGEVVDVACYLSRGAKGEDHMACAKGCAEAGGQLGILTSEGKLFISILPDDHKTGPNTILLEHIGHQVEAKGIVRSKGGVNGLMITSVEMATNEEKK